jgi:hypothetical protein
MNTITSHRDALTLVRGRKPSSMTSMVEKEEFISEDIAKLRGTNCGVESQVLPVNCEQWWQLFTLQHSDEKQS